jgi:hypothetical protein
LKTQKKWERHGDPDSCAGIYDFYRSDFETLFSEIIPLAKMLSRRNEPRKKRNSNMDGIYRRYIRFNLTGNMYERAAEDWGGFKESYMLSSLQFY